MNNFAMRDFIKYNILTTSEAAALLELSKASLSKLVDDQSIKPVKKSPQGYLFLRSDIEAYQRSRKLIPITDDTKKAPLMELDGNTLQCKEFFKKHRHELDDIIAIYIYFDKFDAILDNFYIESPSENYNELHRLYNPYFVLRDITGKELWLGGCNCGYGGVGPNGSAAILRYLRDEGTLDDIHFSDDAIEELKWNRKITLIKDVNDNWDITVSDSSICDAKGASLFNFHNHLVLIQDANEYLITSPLTVLEAYRAFIPNPEKIMIFPNDNLAEQYQYVLYRNYGSIKKTVYNIIITDATQRQIWLRAEPDDKQNIIKSPSVSNILKYCDFDTDPNIIFNDSTDKSLIKRMISWLDTTLRSEPIKPVIIEK